MNKLIIVLIAVVSTFLTNAQTTSLQPLLTQYIQLKDALVKSDTKLASEKADMLFTTIHQVAVKSLPEKDQQNFLAAKDALLNSATAISKATNIEKQRTAFATLSLSVWQVIQTADSIAGNVYYQYCPMKKNYWLSTEATIKNPYYGSAMLSCGNIAAKKIQ